MVIVRKRERANRPFVFPILVYDCCLHFVRRRALWQKLELSLHTGSICYSFAEFITDDTFFRLDLLQADGVFDVDIWVAAKIFPEIHLFRGFILEHGLFFRELAGETIPLRRGGGSGVEIAGCVLWNQNSARRDHDQFEVWRFLRVSSA